MPLDASGIIYKDPLRVFNGNVFDETRQWVHGMSERTVFMLEWPLGEGAA